MPSAYDVVQFVLGVLGVFSVFELGQSILGWNLPRRQLKKLDEDLGITETLFRDSVEDGLPFNIGWIRAMELELNRCVHCHLFKRY